MKKYLRFFGVMVAMLALAQAMAVEFTAEPTAPSTMIQSDKALAYLELGLENKPGWVVGVKGGYRWKFYKDHGTSVRNTNMGINYGKSQNTTKSGGAASVSLGYNFGPRLPLTIGVNLGIGYGANLNTHGNFAANGQNYALASRQKLSIMTLDLGVDYDFKNCSRWTPFVGATAGVAFTSDKGKASLTNLATNTNYFGRYDKKHKVNFVVGGRAGVKYDVNDRIQLSLYGTYNYLGDIKGRSYDLYNGTNAIHARNEKIKVHAVDVKVGLKVRF